MLIYSNRGKKDYDIKGQRKAVFLRGAIVAAVLASVHWEANVAPGSTARQGMTVAFALVPAIFCAVGALLLIFGFKITADKVDQYQKEIDARNA